MSIPLAISQLIETELSRQTGILNPSTTLAIALSRVGADDQRIIAGTLNELLNHPAENYGEPLHSLVIVGKRLHHLEVDYAEEFAINRESWRRVAKEDYKCALE